MASKNTRNNMKVSTTICTYHRTINGDGNNLIKKFSRAGLDNFNVLFDNQKTFSKNEIEDYFNVKLKKA